LTYVKACSGTEDLAMRGHWQSAAEKYIAPDRVRGAKFSRSRAENYLQTLLIAKARAVITTT
jgi:hypothetical protein